MYQFVKISLGNERTVSVKVKLPKRHETRTNPKMNYSMLEEARELARWSKESEALSIYQELGKIEDRRGKKGKRYTLALLLTCILLAKMAGETTLQAIAEWIRLRSAWLDESSRANFTGHGCHYCSSSQQATSSGINT